MRFYLTILFFAILASCNTTGGNEAKLVLSDADRISKLELLVASLIKDTVNKSKQIIALKKNDSTYNLKVNSEAVKLKNLIYVFSSDSINQWKKINLLYPIITRFTKDSASQWVQIKSNLSSIRFTKDSSAQWVIINKLQSASPVTQIPIIQSQVKAIQTKNLSQDITLTSIKKSNDSLQNFVIKYAVIIDSSQYVISNGIATIKAIPDILIRLKIVEDIIRNNSRLVGIKNYK